MTKRQGVLAGLIVVACLAIGIACAPVAQNNSQSRDVRAVEQQQNIYQTNQPIPAFTFSQDRDTLIQIYRLRNEARATYTVVTGMNGGEPIWACASRGYAIAADTQLTNPTQLSGAWVSSSSSAGSDSYSDGKGNYYRWVSGNIDLPEPNGLYSSKNTDGTWILCLRPDGSINPIYSELKVQTFPFEVKWDPEKRMLVDVGQKSSSTIDIKAQPAASPAPR